MSSRTEVYQQHLDRVSRSFAFCIRQLPAPLRAWVGLSYLLCRVVDTIEDSGFANAEIQQHTFKRFDHALNHRPFEPLGDDFVHAFSHLSDAEARLIAAADELLQDLHELPVAVGEVIRRLIGCMSSGMQYFCRQKADGELRLRSLPEVNQYCFFVAGVVGELLTHLLARVEPRFHASQEDFLRAHHFGLFLQKVNLLRDQVEDEKVGRHFLPSRDLVEDSSRENATAAMKFLLALPMEQIEFRRFCAWSLFLGLEALVFARKSLVEQQVVKVPRVETDQLLQQLDSCIGDNNALHNLFEARIRNLPHQEKRVSTGGAVIPEWLLTRYQGTLNAHSLGQLGIAVAR